MSYDSLFGTAPPKPPRPPLPTRRRRPPWAVLLLVLAVLGAAVVCVPFTRMVGLGLVAVLAVPVAVFWHRERGNPGHWAATAALGVLGAAFLAGGVVTLVDTGALAPGSPKWAVNLPPDELTETPGPDDLAPAAPDDSLAPSASAPASASPPAAAPAPAKPSPTAASTPSSKPTQAVTRPAPTATPTPTPTTTRHRDTSGEARDQRGGTGDGDQDQTPTTTERETDTSCQLGALRPNADGTYMVCAEPDGQGGYTWRRAQRNDYQNY